MYHEVRRVELVLREGGRELLALVPRLARALPRGPVKDYVVERGRVVTRHALEDARQHGAYAVPRKHHPMRHRRAAVGQGAGPFAEEVVRRRAVVAKPHLGIISREEHRAEDRV